MLWLNKHHNYEIQVHLKRQNITSISLFCGIDFERKLIWPEVQLCSEVGKMATFDLCWGGRGMGCSYESLPAPLATQIPTLWMHTFGGGGGL
jgi:hypothetical protein